MIPLLRFLSRSSKRVVLVSVVAGVVGGGASVGLIALIQAEMGRAAPSDAGRAWAFAGLCAVAGLARVAAQAGMVRLGQGAVNELTRHLVRRILALPLRAFEAMDRSAILTVLTEDIVLIANALVGVPQLCINGPIVLACVAYVGWLSPTLLSFGVVFAVAAIAAFTALSSRGVRRLRAARARQVALVGHFRTLIDGFRELKLHRGRRGAYLDERLEPDAAAVRDLTSSGLTFFAIGEGWSQVMFFAFIGLVLFVLPGLHAIDRPKTLAVVLVVLYLNSPLDVILTWLPILGRARASTLRIEQLLPHLERDGEGEGEGEGAEPRPARPTLAESVELDGVAFAYEGDGDGQGFGIGPVDLLLRRGELVILAGGNGSGKTTLVKLLAGLYAPDSGAVRVDGLDVDAAGREAYRQLFSLVFADGHLFPDLLGLASPGLVDRARDGLARLELADKVSLRDRRFSTVDLSQGQRRRLALLGAILEDRPVCIFDEWAANQDPRFKRAFYRELLPEWKAAGKTLLVISHDEAYFDVGDRIIRLQDGRVVEDIPLTLGSLRP